jgi:hypothetical protein
MAPKRNAGKARAAPPQSRRTKLARDNEISAEQESEISEAFLLFSVHDLPDYEHEAATGVLRIEDVRRVLM